MHAASTTSAASTGSTPAATRSEGRAFTAAHALSIVAALLAAAASAVGLLWPELYSADTLWASAQCRGNDLVTLVVAVPVLIAAVVIASRGSARARLVWLGMLGYLFYGYAFYLFGMAFNRLFLVYVAIFAISLYVLIFELARTDAEKIARRFAASAPVRTVAGYLLFVAAFLALMWSARVIGFLATGEVPGDIVSSGAKSAIVYALDLTLLVPSLAISAVLLWKRRAWGYVLGAVVLAKCTAYPLALIGMGVFAADAGVVSDYYMMYFWVFFAVASTVIFVLMLRGLKGEAE